MFYPSKDSKIGNINIKNKRGLELGYEWDKDK